MPLTLGGTKIEHIGMRWPTDFRNRPAKLIRVKHEDGSTVMFTTRDGASTGRSPLQFFDVAQVPTFEGGEAWFEVERVRGGARIVRIVRRIDEP
jgi:hypothetical protein